jgi:hypothetical protein
MVDELELLKRDWKKQEASLPKVTAKEIYPMLLKKSSSIVKWIFIISIIEFVFWIAVNFLYGNQEKDKTFVQETGLETFNTILLVINYSALAFFVIRFYLNYKKIEATDTARQLMQNILRTRKTVKYYIWFNLMFLAVGSIIAFIIVLQHDPEKLAGGSIMTAAIALILLMALIIGILFVFYRLLYGVLLKRLNRNYEELKKMEV